MRRKVKKPKKSAAPKITDHPLPRKSKCAVEFHYSVGQRVISGEKNDQAKKGGQSKKVDGKPTTRKIKCERRIETTTNQDRKKEATMRENQRKSKGYNGHA